MNGHDCWQASLHIIILRHMVLHFHLSVFFISLLYSDGLLLITAVFARVGSFLLYALHIGELGQLFDVGLDRNGISLDRNHSECAGLFRNYIVTLQ